MKRPAAIGGRALPRDTGRCALCGEPLGDPRAGSIELIRSPKAPYSMKNQLVCRDRQACMDRRRAE